MQAGSRSDCTQACPWLSEPFVRRPVRHSAVFTIFSTIVSRYKVSAMVCIGLDLGTTKVAGAVIDTGSSGARPELIGTMSRDHGATLDSAGPGEHVQDADRIIAVARGILRDLAPASAPVGALCLTGQVHGILYADAGGRAVSPLASWLDGRSGARSDRPSPAGTSHAEELSRRTGYRVPVGYGTATHFSNLLTNRVPPGAKRACTLLEYATHSLITQDRWVADASLASSVGLFNQVENTYDVAAFDAAGLSDVEWAGIVPALSRVGTTDDGIAVYAPIGDNQAGVLGSVRSLAGSVLLNVGTGGQVSIYSRSPIRLAPPLEIRPFPDGGVLLVGAAICSGKAYAALADFFAAVCGELGVEAKRAAVYERMNELALLELDEPAEPDPEVDTRLSGTRNDGTIRGSITQISLANFTPGALVRGFVRGITSELFEYYSAIASAASGGATHASGETAADGGTGTRPATLVGIGNGIRRNPALRRELTRVFGSEVHVPRHREEAAVGAAVCAAVGSGACADFASTSSVIDYE